MYSPKQTKVGLKLLIAVMMILVSTDLCAEKLPHYIFVLPDGYTGWIQVIFDSPGSAPLVLENDNAVLHIKNGPCFYAHHSLADCWACLHWLTRRVFL